MIKFSVGPAIIAAAKAVSVDRLSVEGSFVTLDVADVEGGDAKAEAVDEIAADILEEARTIVPEHAFHLKSLAAMVAHKKRLVRDNKVQSDTHITQDENTGSHSLPSGESVSTDSSTQSSDEENEEIEDGREAQQPEGDKDQEAELEEAG